MMLLQLTRDIATRMNRSERPVEVIYEGDGADSRFKAADHLIPSSNRITLDYAEDGSDTFEPPIRIGTVQKTEAFNATIDGVSTKGGAAPRDHKAVALKLTDAFVVALFKTCQVGSVTPSNVRGGFVSLGADGPQSGARYLLSFSISRGVPEAELDQVVEGNVTTSISLGVRVGLTDVELSCSPLGGP